MSSNRVLKDSNKHQREYYSKNKDKFMFKEPFKCPCGGSYKHKTSKSKHEKSKRHKNYLSNLNNNNINEREETINDVN